MDLNDANQSCNNTGDVRNVGERLEQEPASNNAPVEISDKIDSKSIDEDKKTSASHRQQNGYFQKETESCEIVANVWNSFNAFQRTIVDIHKKDKLRNDVSYGHTSVIERPPTSYTFGNLLPDTSESRIQVIAENNDKDVKDIGIISTRALPTTESSSSESTIIPKCENWPSFSNAGFHKCEMHCDIFDEDDDWDIYQPGIVTTEHRTESSLESQFSFERLVLKNAKYLSKNNSKSSVDYDSCQRISPCIARETSYSPSSNSVNNGGTFPEWNEERMLKEVKEYFLNNPVQATGNLSDLESKKWIITAPYFSRDFALRHGLPLPTITTIQELNLLEDDSYVSRLLAAYEIISNLGISEEDFFRYISLDNHRLADTSPRKWYTYSGLDPSTIQHLDLIQEQVGHDVFPMIYKQLRTGDAEFRAIFRDQELLNDAIQFWNGYGNDIELLREKNSNILSQNQADSTSDAISEDILVSQTNTDFPRTTSQTHVINSPGLNASEPNSYSYDGHVKALHKSLKTSRSSTDLSKVQSIKSNDISETEPKKCSSILQSTNQDNKGSRRSFDSFQGHSDKSNDSPDPASVMFPHIQNSVDENYEEKSSKVHLVKSKNSPNNATRSSDQNFKENSRDDQSGKSNEVLENVSNVQSGVRKYISQDNDTKSRKKIRLQENSNTAQPEAKKEQSPIKDESRTPSEDSWPGKPGKKSCIVM